MSADHRIDIIHHLAIALERLCAGWQPAAAGLRWWLSPQSYVEGNRMRITTEQRVTVTVVPRTAAGREARIDGPVRFETSDPDALVARLEVLSDTSARLTAAGPGVLQVTATFDADLDEGEVREIMASGVLEVVAAEAEQGEIVFGEP